MMITGRAFLSHSHLDQAVALDLRRALQQRGIDTYAFEYDMPFGGPIVDAVEKELTNSDYVLVLLSDAARRSTWVSRELGLALQLQESSRMTHPAIIGVRTDRPLASAAFDILDFRSVEPTGLQPYDFAASRIFDYRSQDDAMLEAFFNFLLPKITFVEDEADADQELLKDSLRRYEEAFPDVAERDSPEDILDWLRMDRRAAETGGQWREVYGVLGVAGRAVGMSFFTAHLHREWSFANYFTVRNEWRQLRRAEWFLKHVVDRLSGLVPSMKGILFEIAPIDMQLLRRASREPTIAELADRKRIIANLRALRRLNWYQSYRARAIVGSDGEPIEYWQPAMDEAMLPENRRRLIPMVLTFDGSEVLPEDIYRIIDFLYDDLYGDAYTEGPMTRERYRAYVRDMKQIVLGKLNGGIRLGPIGVPDSVRVLLHRVKREGLLDELSL